MAAEPFDAFADLRAYAAAQLAVLDQVNLAALTPLDRAAIERLRASFLDLQASLSEEMIAAELEATVYAGRDLTPAEVAAIRKRQ